MKLSVLVLSISLSVSGLVGCGSSAPEAAEPVAETRVPITSASQLKVHIEDFAFLLDGLRDLGLDCGKFDQIDAWIKPDHEFALCTYKDVEVALTLWYLDATAEREISSGAYQPWCQPYVRSNNWAIATWNAPVIREFASVLELDAEQFKTAGNASGCLL